MPARDVSDVTAEMLRSALIKRAVALTPAEMLQASDCFDTAEVPDD